MSTFNWWQQQPTTAFGTRTGITLSTGAVDVEKGSIYNAPAGSPIAVPVISRIEWEDSQHVVIRTAKGILNFLHVNPTEPVGTVLEPGHPFGKSSTLVGSTRDPNSGITYVESGNIIEVGLYDTVARAKNRENFVNGVDQPFDFTGISDPSQLFKSWGGKGADFASSADFLSLEDLFSSGTSTDGKPSCPICKFILIGGIALLVILLLRRR